MATPSNKRVHLAIISNDHDLSIFTRRDLFLHLLSYLNMKETVSILTINKELNEWINHYATIINRCFGLPFYINNSNQSLWTSINNLMSKSVLQSKNTYIIPHIKHKETIYFMSYKQPYLLIVSWDHSFSIIRISENNTIKLTKLCKFGANNYENYFGANKESLFKFSNWEQFYSIDFSQFIHKKNEKLLIAFGGNINLYLAIFDMKTNKFDIVSHAFEEEQEFNHNKNHQSRDVNQHWIRTCKIAPNYICDININGYFLIISGHGYDGEVFGVLAVNKQCKIIYQNIQCKQGYSGCELQTRSIEFYYDKEHNIKLLMIAVTDEHEDEYNSLLIYSIHCLKYKVELKLINRIDDLYDCCFFGAISMRNEYLITTGEGGVICLWKINKEYLTRNDVNQLELFTLITKYQDVSEDILFVNQIDFFHDNFFTVCSSSGTVLIIHINENKLNIIKIWTSKSGFWSLCCVRNYILCGNEDGKLCCYSFQ